MFFKNDFKSNRLYFEWKNIFYLIRIMDRIFVVRTLHIKQVKISQKSFTL